MADRRRKFDAEFREGAVRIVAETGRPVVQVAEDLGIDEAASMVKFSVGETMSVETTENPLAPLIEGRRERRT